MGARGTNNLASKFLITLFPPGSAFFRWAINEGQLNKLAEKPGFDKDQFRVTLDEALADLENAVEMKIEASGVRAPLGEGLKHLIVTGNVLTYSPKDFTGIKIFHLDRFVVVRDGMGKVLEIVCKESITPEALDEVTRARLKGGDGDKKELNTVDVYTHVRLLDKKWKQYQEVQGEPIIDSESSYPEAVTPWNAVRFIRIDGEDYGRGLVEEIIGDLNALEGLTQALVEGSIGSSKLLFGINPNANCTATELGETPNGGFVSAKKDDVWAIQADKFADLRVAREQADEIKKDLAYVFLLNSAVQRQGERVTAEEIRYLAGELEDALGSVYTLLAQELQLPLLNRFIYQMKESGELPPLPSEAVTPVIVTGLAALGRNHDLNKLNSALTICNQTLTPQVMAPFLDVGNIIKRIFTASGVSTKGAIKSADQMAQEQQQAQAQNMLQKLGPAGIKAATDLKKQQNDKQTPDAQAAPSQPEQG